MVASPVVFIGSGGQARPWEHTESFLSLLETAANEYDNHPDSMRMYRARQDSIAWKRHVEEQRAAGRRVDEAEFVKRTDSFNGEAGVYLPRQLEHIHSRVINEKRPTPNAFKKFRQEGTIPPGARTHTVRRYLEQGSAGWYRKGQEVPKVSGKQKEEQFPVRHVVSSVRMNHFEALASDFAKLNKYGRDLASSRRTIELFLNKALWNGDDDVGFKGVANYPYLAKMVTTVNFYDDGSTDPDDVIAALNSAANYPADESKEVFAPNRMLTSSRVRTFLTGKPRQNGSDMSVGKWFLENNEFISKIETAWELKNIGGTGVDGILFYNDDRDSICHEAAQGLTILPQQAFGFDKITYVYMSSGGIVMRDSGGNILLLVPAAA